jgi:hypothetical protein
MTEKFICTYGTPFSSPVEGYIDISVEEAANEMGRAISKTKINHKRLLIPPIEYIFSGKEFLYMCVAPALSEEFKKAVFQIPAWISCPGRTMLP